MEYEQLGEGLVNQEAYESNVVGEQGGVVHLVHGWIQQKQPEKVSFIY